MYWMKIVFICFFIINIIITTAILDASQVSCNKRCGAENFNSLRIRYGKYCGVGWTRCPGESPWHDLDVCCQIHNECVDKRGMTNVKCHEKFKRCIKKVQKSDKAVFSRDCPVATAMPTMQQGIDMAI